MHNKFIYEYISYKIFSTAFNYLIIKNIFISTNRGLVIVKQLNCCNKNINHQRLLFEFLITYVNKTEYVLES